MVCHHLLTCHTNSQRSIDDFNCGVVLNSVLGTCQLWVGPRRIRHSKPLLWVAAAFIITDPLVLRPKTRYRGLIPIGFVPIPRTYETQVFAAQSYREEMITFPCALEKSELSEDATLARYPFRA